MKSEAVSPSANRAGAASPSYSASSGHSVKEGGLAPSPQKLNYDYDGFTRNLSSYASLFRCEISEERIPDFIQTIVCPIRDSGGFVQLEDTFTEGNWGKSAGRGVFLMQSSITSAIVHYANIL
jgi:hypothetical protein